MKEEEMWRAFHQQTTEMILTRIGRNIFPKLEYKIHGLLPEEKYIFYVHFERVDDFRYKYSDGKWQQSSRIEESKREHLNQVIQKNVVQDGKFWMKNGASFDYVKITNNVEFAEEEAATICLTSMCCYIPVLTIRRVSNGHLIPQPSASAADFVYRDPICKFITVTAYQSKAITALKVQYNNFASGFRKEKATNNSRNGIKRQSSSISSSTNSCGSSPKRALSSQEPTPESSRILTPVTGSNTNIFEIPTPANIPHIHNSDTPTPAPVPHTTNPEATTSAPVTQICNFERTSLAPAIHINNLGATTPALVSQINKSQPSTAMDSPAATSLWPNIVCFPNPYLALYYPFLPNLLPTHPFWNMMPSNPPAPSANPPPQPENQP